jgi:peptide methionine sulfoxide reductase MsrA
LYRITIEDPEKLNEYYEDRGKTLIPAIYIKYEHMKSILKSTPPTSRTAFKKLKKQVYTRSRTRGFFKPSEVDEYAKTIIDFYLADI